jgi:hypothetical protein
VYEYSKDRSEKVHPYAKRLVIFGYVIAAAGIILGPLYIDTEGKDNVFTTWQNIAYKRIHAFFTPTETDIQGKFLVSPDAGLELIYRKQLTKKHVDRLLDIQKASE